MNDDNDRLKTQIFTAESSVNINESCDRSHVNLLQRLEFPCCYYDSTCFILTSALLSQLYLLFNTQTHTRTHTYTNTHAAAHFSDSILTCLHPLVSFLSLLFFSKVSETQNPVNQLPGAQEPFREAGHQTEDISHLTRRLPSPGRARL